MYLYLKRLKLLFSIGLIFSMRYRSDDYDNLSQHIYHASKSHGATNSLVDVLICQRLARGRLCE